MRAKEKSISVRFMSSHRVLESSVGHPLRTMTELHVCEWLAARRIAHEHATEVFTVVAAANGLSGLFVPDIILRRKTKDGRKIIIESLHPFSPKRGGQKNLTAFRTQYREQFVTIVVGKKATLDGVPKSIAKVRVELENLDMLQKKIDELMR